MKISLILLFSIISLVIPLLISFLYGRYWFFLLLALAILCAIMRNYLKERRWNNVDNYAIIVLLIWNIFFSSFLIRAVVLIIFLISVYLLIMEKRRSYVLYHPILYLLVSFTSILVLVF